MENILAEVIRNGRIESRHRGHVAVVNADGALMAGLGDTDFKSYIRSAAKPIQVLPLLESGAVAAFGFNEKELAVIMASHSAEDYHLKAVRSIQKKAGLCENDLKCGFHPPLDSKMAEEFIRQEKPKSPLFNNCSGKHSGMLALAQFNNWPLDNYLETSHPVQMLIKKQIAVFSGLPESQIATGIDGCSAPVFYLPVKNMALMYARLAAGRLSKSRQVFAIMSQHAEMVAGTGRFDTAIMQTCNGRLISKIGAEGIRCIGVRAEQPLGIALKIEDGNVRVSAGVMLEILRQLHLISEAELNQLESFHRPKLTNCAGIEIGEIRPAFRLETFATV